MKLKLVRLANVFHPSFHQSFILFFAVIAIGCVYSRFRWDYVLSGVLLLSLYFILFPILNYPKFIEFYEDRICYASPENLPRKRGKGFVSAKVRYQVTDITRCTVEQTKIERLFGFAHLVFSGQTTLDVGKYTDRFQPKRDHCVYGIRYNKYRDAIASYCKQYKTSTKER